MSQPSQQDEILARRAGGPRPASSRSSRRSPASARAQIVRKRFLGHSGAIIALGRARSSSCWPSPPWAYLGFIPGWWKYNSRRSTRRLNGGAPTLAVAARLGRPSLRPGPDRPRPLRHDHARHPAVHHRHGRDRPHRRPDRRRGRRPLRLLPRLDRSRPDAPHRRHHHLPASAPRRDASAARSGSWAPGACARHPRPRSAGPGARPPDARRIPLACANASSSTPHGSPGREQRPDHLQAHPAQRRRRADREHHADHVRRDPHRDGPELPRRRRQGPGHVAGLLISQNQEAFATRPWLFWFPGLFIVRSA